MDYIIVNGELYHHGIRGQRWGVRRFQNADGSLTAAGRRRRNSDDDRVTARSNDDIPSTARRNSSDNDNNTTASTNGRRRAADMSTEELNNANRRFAAEQTYRRYTGEKTRGELTKEISDNTMEIGKNSSKFIDSAYRIKAVSQPAPDYSGLSDAELRSRVNRLQLEQQYSNLNKPGMSKGQVYVKEAIEMIATGSIVIGSIASIVNAVRQMRGN